MNALTITVQFHHAVEGTVIDTNSALTERQCIDVIVNNECNERGNSFSVQLEYSEGDCNNREDIQGRSITRQTINYTTCVPFELQIDSNTICFSGSVFQNGTEVGMITQQQLVLMPCNTSALNLAMNVRLNLSSGEIVSPGEEVAHNTVLFLYCETGMLDGELNSTRCVNGTFNSNLNSTISCTPTNMIVGKLLWLYDIILVD